MVRKDYNIEFNNTINLKINGLLKELHKTYEVLIECCNLIDKYKDLYKDAGVDINNIYNPFVSKKINIEYKKDLLKPLQYNFIKTYNYIISDKIKNINKQINILSSIRNIPYEIFVHLQDEYNIEIINSLLKGNKYSLGNNLGTLKVKTVNRNFNNKLVVNWGETRKVKQELINNNISLYSSDNVKGTKYFVYHTDDTFSFFNWRKSVCKIVNKDYYRFSVIKNGNIKFEDIKNPTEKEILNNRSLGGYDKLMFLLKLNPSIKYKYK